MYQWQTLPDGTVQVDGSVPTLTAQNANAFDERVWRWRELAAKHGVFYGVPIHWVLGMIYAESLGNPDAKSRDGGYGLMQLTSAAARKGKSYEELRNPDLNIQLGAEFIKLYCLGKNAPDLPRVASKYNAGMQKNGAPHPGGEPWGMRETKGHISRVVSASNYALSKLRTFSSSGLDNMSMLMLGLSIIRWLG